MARDEMTDAAKPAKETLAERRRRLADSCVDALHDLSDYVVSTETQGHNADFERVRELQFAVIHRCNEWLAAAKRGTTG